MDNIFKVLAKYSLVISLAITAIFFFIFYLSKYVNIDEHDYLNNAKLILQGDLKHDCNLNIEGQFPTSNGCISKYNIGTSIFYIPAALINDKLAFLITLIFFLISIYIFYLLLKEFSINTFFLYFYAFFPPLVYYSRTLFSEIYSITFILLTVYSLIKLLKSNNKVYGILCGISASIAILIRYTNIIPLFILIAGLLFFYNQSKIKIGKKEITYAAIIIASMLPIIICLLLFNLNSYGALLRSGYYYSGEEGAFALGQFPVIFIKYVLLLNIIYPGMLIVALISKLKYRWLFFLTSFIVVIFYSLVKNITFAGKLSDLLLSMRLVLPIVPLLILSYSSWFNDLLKNKLQKRKWALIVIFIAAIISVFSIHLLHFLYLQGK